MKINVDKAERTYIYKPDYSNARLRYWQHHVPNGSCWRFLHSRERVDGKYLALRARWMQDLYSQEGHWMIVQVMKFGVRWKATDRAYRWFCKCSGRSFETQHDRKKLTADEKEVRRQRLVKGVDGCELD